MIDNGKNRKSMAYVENVAAFLEYSIHSNPGKYIYNYVDKPDFNMNTLVQKCNGILQGKETIGARLPKWVGLLIACGFDIAAFLTKKRFTISSIRVKKFCADSTYSTAIEKTSFKAPTPLEEALRKTLQFEFLEDNSDEPEYFSE